MPYMRYRGRDYFDEDSLRRAKAKHSCTTPTARFIISEFFKEGQPEPKEIIAQKACRGPAAVTIQVNKYIVGYSIDIELAMIIACMDYKTAKRLSGEFCKADFIRLFFQRGLISHSQNLYGGINLRPNFSHNMMQEDLEWIKSLKPVKRQRKKANDN